MNLKKRLLSVVCIAALTAGIWMMGKMGLSPAEAVSEDNEAGACDESALAADKETLHVYYSDDSLTSYISSAAVSFGEREGVRILPVLITDSEYMEALNRASLEDGQTPDVYLVSHDSLEKAYLAGLAIPLQDPEGILNGEHFSDAALCAVTYQGKLVAYPLYFETSALLYNQDYLLEWAGQKAYRELSGEEIPGDENIREEPTPRPDAVFTEEELQALTLTYFEEGIPETVDDILNIAESYDAPETVDAIMRWDVSDIFYNYWFIGNSVSVGGDCGDDKNQLYLTGQETANSLEIYKALHEFFSIEPNQVSYESCMQDFLDGKLVFTIGTTDAVARIEEAKADQRFHYSYGVVTMPQVSVLLPRRSLSVTGTVAVNGYSGHRRLAERFAAYLADEYADRLYSYSGRVPAASNAELQNGALEIFRLEYADSVPLPKLMSTGNYWLQLEVLFSRIWSGADVAEELQALENQMREQMQ